MQYVLGIDSGGTKYLIKACALDGTLLSTHTGPTAYHTRVGVDEAYRRIKNSISACLLAFGGKPRDCRAIVVGTAGLDVPGDEEDIEAIYRRIEGFDCPLVVLNDAEIAHFAVTGGIGVVAIAGTGSIAFGRDRYGKECRAGGWPQVIGGDEGSGTFIANQALAHFSCVLDGMQSAGPLAQMLQSRAGIQNARDLMDVCERIQCGNFQDPGISLWVNEAAAQSDAVADDILRRAGQAVAKLALGVIRQLNFENKPFTVGVWGSAIVKSKKHLCAFTEAVTCAYPCARVCIAQSDAADGAVQMALRQIKV